MLNGVFGLVLSSSGVCRLGPRSVATTSASGANGGTPEGSDGAWRNVETMVAMFFGTV